MRDLPADPEPDALARRRAAAALLLLAPAPAVGVWAALFAWPGAAGTGLYLLLKAWVLLLPWLWTRRVEGAPFAPWRGPRQGRRDLVTGLVTGGLVAAASVAFYALFGARELAGGRLADTAARLGLETPRAFVLGALGYTFVNSLLEEYLWRWFATPRCVRLLGARGGVALAALLFTLHHVLALLAYLDPPWALLASAGVFAGGALWSWLLVRTGSLWPGWLSHVLADAAIFAAGYHALFAS
jgi:membrane protease YdiL (CAAX protease family)